MRLPIILKVLLPVLILAGGVGAWWYLKNLAPEQKERASFRPSIRSQASTAQTVGSEEVPPGVPVVAHALEQQDYTVMLEARATVEAGEEVELTAEVEGRIQALSPEFEVGAIVPKGTVLARLDDADLQDQLIVAQARVAQAAAALAQEQVRADQALVNWNELAYEEAPSDLVLRKPQLRQAHAALAAAQSQVDLAQRALSRVELRAPMDGIIAERTVSQGERIGKGRSVGRLISTDYSQLSLPVRADQLAFLPTPIQGTTVRFRHALAPALEVCWSGYLTHRVPEVDPTTKQLHLAARVVDPYSLEGTSQHSLPVGQPVVATITAQTLSAVYVVPKAALRSPEEIYITGPDRVLRSLPVTPLITDEQQIVFRAELPEGTHWVETKLRSHLLGETVSITQGESPSPVAED